MLNVAQNAVVEFIERKSAPILDIESELAAPFDEGAFSDTEFGGDASETPALGTEIDKFLDCILIFHSKNLFAPERSVLLGPLWRFLGNTRSREEFWLSGFPD